MFRYRETDAVAAHMGAGHVVTDIEKEKIVILIYYY